MSYIIRTTYKVHEVHEFSVDCGGNNFNIIYGQHISGWFISIPNWNICVEASEPTDIFYNTERLLEVMDKDMSQVPEELAKAIKEHWSMQFNTQIDYLYRDASNYKKRNQQIVSGTLTDEQIKEIMASCNEGEYFIPRQVGLPEERFKNINKDDHCWFEMRHIFKVDAEPTIALTATEVYQNFLKASGNWDETLCLEHD